MPYSETGPINSKNIVCVSSSNSIGCTFVDWSIHFLSGQTQFYSVAESAWIPLSTNPVNSVNAHGHKKNHPSGFDRTKKTLEHLKNTSTGDFFTFYPSPLLADLAAKQLGLYNDQPLTDDTFKKIQIKQRDDYADLINYCLKQKLKVIYMSLNSQDVLYSTAGRSADRLFFSSHKPRDMEESKNHFDQLFFKDSIETWSQQGLTNTWDRRERLALNIRPFNFEYVDQFSFDYTDPHLWVDARSMWYNGHAAIKKVMKFCSLAIDNNRWEPWTKIYAEWQKVQLKILEFEFNYQHIVDAIVNNWYYEIDDLTFDQEVVIQHCLIYQHGLNLKTWQLEKFPSNTQDIHKLLEPNIHPVESIY